MNRFATTLLTALLLYTGLTSALSSTPPATTTQPNNNQQAAAIIISRRHAAASIFSISGAAATSFFTTPVPNANAAEDNQVLTDEEMAARIARKMELLRASKSGGGSGGPTGRATDIRSDINPEAAVNLRSRSAIENAKIAMEKQKELKTRDNAQKREDLCEMLGRGC